MHEPLVFCELRRPVSRGTVAQDLLECLGSCPESSLSSINSKWIIIALSQKGGCPNHYKLSISKHQVPHCHLYRKLRPQQAINMTTASPNSVSPHLAISVAWFPKGSKY